MIKEAYVSLEVAKLLKEKRFNESCLYYYFSDGKIGKTKGLKDRNCPSVSTFSMPTHQMAMRWLREVHNIIFVFKPAFFSGENCTFWTYELWCGDNFEGEILSFKTYEDAVEAALKYTLENLI